MQEGVGKQNADRLVIKGFAMSFRVIALSMEILILMAMLFSMLLGVGLLLFDTGLHPKYSRFIRWVLALVGGLVSAFFVAHLALFYPKLVP
jgi:hypothetical protein